MPSSFSETVESTAPSTLRKLPWAKKEIETLHGNINIKIPEKTTNGTVLRLKELGLPKKSGGYGNLNVKIELSIPKDLSKEEIQLYEKLLNLEKNKK